MLLGALPRQKMDDDENVILDTSNEEDGVIETDEIVKDEAVEEDAEKIKELNKKLFERAKKAETELKKLKAETKKPEIESKTNVSSVDPDELKLIARGFSDEEIEQAKVISKGKDVSMSEATKDPLFITYREKVKEDERREKAKLGATKGSPQVEDKGVESGMNRDDHKEAWKKATGTK